MPWVQIRLKLDYSKAYAIKAPEENRFTKMVLTNDLNEPMEIAVTQSGVVYIVERSGNFYAYKPTDNINKLIHKFQVCLIQNKHLVMGYWV